MKDNLILTAHRITKVQKEKAIKIGKGNESKGVRIALESCGVSDKLKIPENYERLKKLIK